MGSSLFQVKLLGGLCLGCAVAAGVASTFVKEGSGMGGLFFLLIAGCLGLCSMGFGIAALWAAASVKARSDRMKKPLRKITSVHSKPTSEPLLQSFEEWKASEHRPAANYEEFLHNANPRRFPVSKRTLFCAGVVMMLILVLLFRR